MNELSKANHGVLKRVNNSIKKSGVQVGVIIGLLILIIVLSAVSPMFMTSKNLINILRQISINAIIAFGMTFVILIGGIDLSVGSVVAVTGLVAIYLANLGVNSALVFAATLAVGALFGLVNGFIVARFNIAPFVVTLATMTIFRGVCYIVTGGRPIRLTQNSFSMLGNGYLIGIPIPVIVLLVAFLFAHFLLARTRFGRHVYILGGNKEAAKLSGINVDRVTVLIFVISGAFAALSGQILASRLLSGQPSAGDGYELDAIAAAVLGGTNISGGYGTILGTLVGAIILGVLSNGMNLLQINSYWQAIVKGVIILLAILMDVNRKKRSN